MTISKTDYILYRECAKNAWYKIHRPEVYYESELSEFEKTIIETGNEVELVARKLFPGGVLVEGRDEKAQKETQDLIAKKQEVIFQPVFVKDGFIAAADIITFDDKTNTYSLYEVKASNEVKEDVHPYDLAFQANLLRSCGLVIDHIYLIHLNSEYIRNGELNIVELFNKDDLTEKINSLCAGVATEMEIAKKYLLSEKEPEGPCCCLYKGRSAHCTTFKHHNSEVPEYSIHDLSRIGASRPKLAELVDSNIFHIHEIGDRVKLSPIQQNQVEAFVSNRPIIKTVEIEEELASLVFPLYFLDYETFPAAIPRFDGFKPYQQITFQYSLHVLRDPASELEHSEFLYTAKGDPSQSLVDSLKKDIGLVGSIIVWNKKFECGRNEELARIIPEAKTFMDNLNSRVYDLMEIFSKQHYVHKDFRGSASIKKVLPVMVPELSYKELDIHDGGAASQSWNKVVTDAVNEQEGAKIVENLKVYCGLDTYAMYAIWKELKNIIDGGNDTKKQAEEAIAKIIQEMNENNPATALEVLRVLIRREKEIAGNSFPSEEEIENDARKLYEICVGKPYNLVDEDNLV